MTLGGCGHKRDTHRPPLCSKVNQFLCVYLLWLYSNSNLLFSDRKSVFFVSAQNSQLLLSKYQELKYSLLFFNKANDISIFFLSRSAFRTDFLTW